MTKSCITTRARPNKEEKELFPCKKSGHKNPAKKAVKAGRGAFKSGRSTEPVTKLNKEKLNKLCRHFINTRTDKLDTKEYEYAGGIVEPKTADSSTASRIIKSKRRINTFGDFDVKSTAPGQSSRRGLPDGTLIVDGATGSELDRRGVDCSPPLWSARANLDAPDVLRDVHRQYLKNGAGAITTNTFRTHERSLNKVGLGHLAKSLTQSAVQMAVDARDELNPDALVLGCVAPLEQCYNPNVAPDFATCKKEHR